MKIASSVTFGGGGLNRASASRSHAADLATADDAQVILLWRGKVMVKNDRLVRVAADHPILQDAAPERVFLGQQDWAPLFAANLTGWQPAGHLPDANGFSDTTLQSHPALPDAGFAELRAVMTRLDGFDAELAATARAVFGWHATHGFCAKCGAKSHMTMGGWQRNCPACGAQHYPRTDPVVIMLITHGNAVLVGRSPGWPEGMYSLLAGFVEPGETIEAAVRRETLEEVGVTVGPVSYLASQPWPFPASLMLGCRGTALDTALTIDPVEIEDAKWVSREDMADVFAGQHKDILPAREGAIAHFLLRAWLADRLD